MRCFREDNAPRREPSISLIYSFIHVSDVTQFKSRENMMEPKKTVNWLLRAAQMAGGVTSAAGTVLWAVLLNRHGGNSTGYFMIALAVVGITASLLARSIVLAVVAIVSFVPVGVYMLGSPSVWAWIGRSEVLMLLAAIVMGLAKRLLARP